ncbi:hypothetical protein DFH27DRAFT_649858 [Peziza echinospora]|nr:hypothetical protein DFH27DRAFT_649858 [Peziza echinospora]
MGSASSKASRIASQSTATRKYPLRDPTSQVSQVGLGGARADTRKTTTEHNIGPEVHPAPSISVGRKDDSILNDAADPDFASMLQRVGVAETSTTTNPNPNSLTRGTPATSIPLDRDVNPSHHILASRNHLRQLMEDQTEDPAQREHRRWVDTATIRQILVLRDDKKLPAPKIEEVLGLAEGTVERLGGRVEGV